MMVEVDGTKQKIVQELVEMCETVPRGRIV